MHGTYFYIIYSINYKLQYNDRNKNNMLNDVFFMTNYNIVIFDFEGKIRTVISITAIDSSLPNYIC